MVVSLHKNLLSYYERIIGKHGKVSSGLFSYQCAVGYLILF